MAMTSSEKIFRRSDNMVISSHDGNVKRTYKLKKDIVVGNIFSSSY